jgi:hypothetical protein
MQVFPHAASRKQDLFHFCRAAIYSKLKPKVGLLKKLWQWAEHRFRRAAFYSQLKSKVGNILAKATALR